MFPCFMEDAARGAPIWFMIRPRGSVIPDGLFYPSLSFYFPCCYELVRLSSSTFRQLISLYWINNDVILLKEKDIKDHKLKTNSDITRKNEEESYVKLVIGECPEKRQTKLETVRYFARGNS